MKITCISLWKVPLTSHETYYMADGKTCETVDSIVVKLDTNTGLEGWGEVCPIPHYLPAYADGVAPAIEEMAPAILGADPIGVEALMAKLDIYLQVDIALWDLTAKQAGLPLYAFLGGRHNESLPLYHSITCVEPDEMVRIAQNAKQQGITQFQAKLGADNDWQADVARLIKVREAVAPEHLVYGDWNCGSPKLEAIRVARAVAHLDIMLEQPCKTLEECSSVKQACGLAMKIDENAYDIASLLRAYELDCLDAVALKLSKFGGLSAMRHARDLCVYLGAKMCVEDTWGSDIVTATCVHLATATPEKNVLNTCDLSGYVAPRLDEGGPMREDGRISISDKPGHGIAPSSDILGSPFLILD